MSLPTKLCICQLAMDKYQHIKLVVNTFSKALVSLNNNYFISTQLL